MDDPRDEVMVKQPDELAAEGGRFYTIRGVSWCDTATEEWYLIPGKGYVRADPNDPMLRER